ncbi:MAG: 5,10-methylenetetrahydromethanopterin reductase [Chloroflexi bacterium]|nr:5,10-methylenetetrahydromethanopterin reductase [Chloroflexota bacterium]
MKFDIDFDSGVVYPGTTIADLAHIAEENGFDAAWKGESNSHDPIVCLTAMAMRTSTIKLGTGIYQVFGRSPVTLGIQAATLNDLSGGRALIGIGVSNQTLASWHGATFDRPIARMREYAAIVRAVAAGERVEASGGVYSTSPFKLSWKPSYPKVPIFFAGLGEQMTRLAGRHADGILINMADRSTIRTIVQRVRQAASDAGRNPDSLEYIAKVRVCINHNISTARNRLKHVLAFYNLADHYRDMIGNMGFEGESADVREAYRDGGFRAAVAAVPDSLVEALPTIAAASVSDARARAEPYLETGITRLVVPYVTSTDDPVGETRAFLEGWNRKAVVDLT